MTTDAPLRIPRSEHLSQRLQELADSHDIPGVVIADTHGLLVATSGSGRDDAEEVAALTALHAEGLPGRAPSTGGRIKSRRVEVEGEVLVVGSVGDTTVCAAVFDRAEEHVRGLVD